MITRGIFQTQHFCDSVLLLSKRPRLSISCSTQMKTALSLIPGFPENYTCLLLKSAKRMAKIPSWHFMSQYINSPCMIKLQVKITVSMESQCEEAETSKRALSSLHCTCLPCFLPWYRPAASLQSNDASPMAEIAMTQTCCRSSKITEKVCH